MPLSGLLNRSWRGTPRWAVMPLLALITTACGLSDVGPDQAALTKWRAEEDARNRREAIDAVDCSLSACQAENHCIKWACAPEGCQQFGPIDCDDGDLCSENDCAPSTGCVNSPKDCEDGDPCTVDECNGVDGCLHPAKDCDDQNPCTVGETCSVGECVAGKAKDCDDSNPCTDDSCDLTGGDCVHHSPGGQPCDDGDKCTVSTCAAGNTSTAACEAGAPTNCDDGDACTSDSCDAKTGCVNEAIAGC